MKPIRRLTTGDRMAQKLGIAVFCNWCHYQIESYEYRGILDTYQIWIHSHSAMEYCACAGLGNRRAQP